MKIPVTPHVPPRPAADANKPSARRAGQANENAPPDDAEGPASAPSRDFASVLEEVTRPRERAGADEEGDAETFESKSRERAESEPEAGRREERQGGDAGGDASGGGFEQRGAVREAAAGSDAAGARSILHIADLERIVSAVRAQTLAGGVREVTIDLRRSVLEGLRVRLTLDGAGRVAAEFVAGSERVRAQVEARAAELAEVMRSRGLNLTSLRASVGADASGRDAGGGRQELNAPAPAVRRGDAAETSPAGDAANEGDGNTGTTYRA